MVFEYRVLQRNLPRFNEIFVYKISPFRFLFRVQFCLERGLKSKIKKKIQIKTINYSRKQFEQESSGITVVNWELSSSNLDARIDVRHDSFRSIYIYIYIYINENIRFANQWIGLMKRKFIFPPCWNTVDLVIFQQFVLRCVRPVIASYGLSDVTGRIFSSRGIRTIFPELDLGSSCLALVAL